MKRLLNTLRVCGLLMMSIGCQNTPPVTSESEKVDTVQKSETQPASAPEVRQESASTPVQQHQPANNEGWQAPHLRPLWLSRRYPDLSRLFQQNTLFLRRPAFRCG